MHIFIIVNHTAAQRYIKFLSYGESLCSIIKFLGNLFKFKAETIFNRMNIQYILRIKNFFQRRSWAN